MNTNTTTTTSKSTIDNDDNDSKSALYYERLQLQMQQEKFNVEQERFNVEKEKFNVEKEKFNVEKEKFQVAQDRFNAEKQTEEDKFQVKQDKFTFEKQQFQHDMKSEKEKFQYDMQSEKEKFAIEKERFQHDMKSEKEKFQHDMKSEKDMFALERKQFQHDMKNEKDMFTLEKEKFVIEKQKFEEQCQQHTSQLFHHNSLSTFSMIPETSIISSPMLASLSQQQQHHQQYHQQQTQQQGEQQPQQEQGQEHSDNNTFTESNALLNQHTKLLDSVQDSIIDYGMQNAELVDKAMRNLKRRARLLDKKEADFEERSEKLKSYEQRFQELHHENDQLKKELESVKKAEQERIEKERIAKQRHAALKSIFDTNVSSFGGRTDLQYMFITIENLNKTIAIYFYPHKPLIETLWTDPATALFSILKKNWDNGKIPKVLDNTVKLFVSSPDVSIDGKEKEWIQISGDGVESSLPPPYTRQITTQSLVKYTDSRPYRQTFDNDRCPHRQSCAQRKNPNCLYHCGKENDQANNCYLAHLPTAQLLGPHYHIKLKWC